MSSDPAYFKKNLKELEPAARMEALREYDALAYEIQMLRETVALAEKHWNDPPLRNVLIASYALHLRNLALFLWPKELNREWTHPVEAALYAPEGAQIALTKPEQIDSLVAQASQQIAHLTTARLSDPNDERKRWALKEGLALLRDGLDEFMLRADQSKCSPKVKPAVDALHATLTRMPMLTLDTFVGSTQLLSSLTVLPSKGS